MWVTKHELDPCFPESFGQLGNTTLTEFERFIELTSDATWLEKKSNATSFGEIS